MDIADAFRVGSRVDFAGLIRKDGDQAAIAGIEIQVALVGIIQVRLLEDEGHSQDAFPKVNRDLPVCPDKRDMV